MNLLCTIALCASMTSTNAVQTNAVDVSRSLPETNTIEYVEEMMKSNRLEYVRMQKELFDEMNRRCRELEDMKSRIIQSEREKRMKERQEMLKRNRRMPPQGFIRGFDQ